MSWEVITRMRAPEPGLVGVVVCVKKQNQLHIAADLHDRLGKPKRIVFLQDGIRLGIAAGEGKMSRACYRPSPATAARVSATAIIRMFGMEPGHYPAHVEQHEGEPIVVVEVR